MVWSNIFIIHEFQCVFLSGRHISNNIRLVIDLVNYKDLLDGIPLVLFLDFEKAFDMVCHNFIFDTLNFFKFYHFFIKAIKTLYGNNNSSVKLPYGTSPRFNIKRGIRQGCPIAP